MQRVEVSRVFPGGAERLFRRYCDHEGWSDWAGLGRVRLVRDGSPDRNGVGAIRAFKLTPGLREEVTLFEPPADDRSPGRMEYRIVEGPVPLEDHRGEVSFVPESSGTRLVWRVSFRTMPGLGWVVARGLDFVFARVLRRLAGDLASH